MFHVVPVSHMLIIFIGSFLFVLYANSCLLFSVKFRVIVFHPFVDEILVGKIRSCSSDGVRSESLLIG